jgi:ankyrin repeat protein
MLRINGARSWEGTPFEQATYADPEIAKLFMAATQGRTSTAGDIAREEMLRSASFDNNAELVHSLIQQGVNINVADKNGTGWTALMFAAAKGHSTIVQLLIAAGADVNYISKDKQSALTESEQWGHQEVINLLQSAGAIG